MSSENSVPSESTDTIDANKKRKRSASTNTNFKIVHLSGVGWRATLVPEHYLSLDLIAHKNKDPGAVSPGVSVNTRCY